ncbi:type II toxin-antitoxin system PrlF family antitoxin [Proteus terrae]|uniref:type II toxin-antitoxin system PrlF family antitoxin n=1 Tax=Proteus terrae TaxID=1574161 RepID=UPI00298D0CDF|nr:type II toxin-antitoxin system PrlF family antitoxin [Proteus terrae]WPC98654.1 type II toxin-antitoxin system PrlF family antitoxin [Proteus terrae]
MLTHVCTDNIALEADSKITERHQTTIPASIREALHLSGGDRIHYKLLSTGDVLISRHSDGSKDPVMASFLNFLAQDITNHPQTIQPLDISRGFELIEGMDINLDDDITDNE